MHSFQPHECIFSNLRKLHQMEIGGRLSELLVVCPVDSLVSKVEYMGRSSLRIPDKISILHWVFLLQFKISISFSACSGCYNLLPY